MNYKLEDIFELQMGRTPSRDRVDYWDSKDHKWISIADLSKSDKYIGSTKEYLSDIAVKESGISQIPSGTVVMSFKLSIGKVAITTESMYSNEAIMAFKDKHVTQLLPDYVYYMFLGKNWDVGSNKAVKGKTLNKATLSKIEVNVHDVLKQQEIVKVLDKTKKIIENRKQELEQLDNLIKARFVEMFGDIHNNEKKWNIGVINDIGVCVAGATPSTKVSEYWDNGTIPWMSSGEVNKGRIFQTDAKISQSGYDNASTKLVPPKTVVIAMAGQGKTRGMVAITEIELCTNQSICSIVNNKKIDPEYLLYYLKLQYKELRSASTNTDGRGGLNLKIIGNYPIMIPPINVQNKFGDLAKQIDKSKVAVQKALDEAQLLFDSLMQEYFG